VDIQGVIASNPLAVRYVVGVGMAYAVRAYPFHYALVGSPDHRPIAHVVIGRVVNATMFAAAFVG
jgi:phosphoribosylcarboxyaminoimidazole (NCAIR) mutase